MDILFCGHIGRRTVTAFYGVRMDTHPRYVDLLWTDPQSGQTSSGKRAESAWSTVLKMLRMFRN